MIRTKFFFVINQMEKFRIDFQTVRLIVYLELRMIEFTVPHHLGRTVLKYSVLRVFHAQHPGGQNRKAVFFSLYDTVRIAASIQTQRKS